MESHGALCLAGESRLAGFIIALAFFSTSRCDATTKSFDLKAGLPILGDEVPPIPPRCNTETLLSVAESIVLGRSAESTKLVEAVRVYVYGPDATTNCHNPPRNDSAPEKSEAHTRILRRLTNSTKVRVVSVASQAHLFLVVCDFLNPKSRAGNLNHLNATTAHRHVLLSRKTWRPILDCDLAHRLPIMIFQTERAAYCNRRPHGFDFSSIPWLSKLQTLPPPAATLNSSARVFVAAFGALPHGLNRTLRARLRTACERAGRPVCESVDMRQPAREERTRLSKQRAIFCIEAVGDSEYRASVNEDLENGCIPVVTSPLMDSAMGAHWHAWRESSRVLVRWRSPERNASSASPSITIRRVQVPEGPPESTLAEGGVRVSLEVSTEAQLLAALLELSADVHTVRAMQATIAAHAHQMGFGAHEDPHREDAFDVLFRTAARVAEQMDRHCA